MSESADQDPIQTPPEETKKSTPGWVIALFVLAAVLVVAGLIGVFIEEDAPAETMGGGPAGAGALASNLTAGGESGGAGGDGGDGGTKTWSPALMRLGFSFFVGFALGYALRAFFKIAMLVAGLIALALFGLTQLGVVDVDWTRMEELYQGLVGNISEQFSNLKGALTGSLPQAGLAIAGLMAGLRKG